MSAPPPHLKSYRHFTKSTIFSVIEPLRPEISDFNRFTAPEELERIAATASRIPLAQSEADHLADIGGTILWLPIYARLLGYRNISLIQFPAYLAGCGYDATRLKREFGCDFIPAIADRTSYGVASGSVTCVVCFELLEHLQGDPMYMISEANRILADGGSFYLTTPNVLHYLNLVTLMFGGHPFSWSVYTANFGDRHNREYTAPELISLISAGGFDMDAFETLTYGRRGTASKRIIGYLLCLPPAVTRRVPLSMRGAFCHWRGHKAGPVRTRYPEFLYDLIGADGITS